MSDISVEERQSQIDKLTEQITALELMLEDHPDSDKLRRVHEAEIEWMKARIVRHKTEMEDAPNP